MNDMEADTCVSFSCESGDESLFEESESAIDCRCQWRAALSQKESNMSQKSSSEGYSTASDASDSFSFGECEHCSNVSVDSLTLALQELKSGEPPANFFEAHQRLGDSNRSSYEYLEVQKANCKRSSSLKSKKTPPGTPNQMKKAVRFADAFGLDLTFVRHVFDSDNPPVIPPQATQHLDLADSEDEESQSPGQRPSNQSQPRSIVSPRFAQPGDSLCFANRVAAQKVVLERAAASDRGHVNGCIRVANLGFEKEVAVRASNDNWSSSREVTAEHAQSFSDGATDQFRFELPASFDSQRPLAFCIRYSVSGETFWDNNFGENYVFDCYTLNQ